MYIFHEEKIDWMEVFVLAGYQWKQDGLMIKGIENYYMLYR